MLPDVMDCRQPPQDPDIVLDNWGSKTLSHATETDQEHGNVKIDKFL